MSDTQIIDTVLARNRHDGTRLVQILREIQEQLSWLSPATLTHIADRIGWPRAEVSGTADFYSFFHTRQRGKYCVLWSDNITDRMLGNADLMDAMCKKLWLEPGRVSEDGLVSVNTTSCTGLCDQGPAVLVNYRAIPRMTQARLGEMVGLIREQKPVSEWPAEWFAVEDNIRRKDILLGHELKNGQALNAALERGPQAMLAEVKAGRLRGRGGAGFSTGLKWEACRKAAGHGPNPAHYVVCNADEGEPGTFKDRVLLTSYADLVFEGMSIAGSVVGAKKGLLYLRGEYRYLLEPLESVLAARRSAGLLGTNILGKGFDFDIEIHLGAGAYVCGEESAMIESIEGKRGQPRLRPPFVAEVGLFGRPTLEHNMETLYWVREIVERGAEWFASQGRHGRKGLRSFSVSGRVSKPGVHLAPAGITLRELIDEFCEGMLPGHDLYGYLPGGASGGILPARLADVPLDFDTLQEHGCFIGSAAIIVLSQQDSASAAALNAMRFFAHESCGKCTPCRVGTQKAAELMAREAWDTGLLTELAQAMQDASICGLGQAAPNPLLSVLKFFPHELEDGVSPRPSGERAG